MRIASLVPSTTETLFALGLGDSLVARSHACDHPPQALDVLAVTAADTGPASIGVATGLRGLSRVDAAALLAAAPDVIFAPCGDLPAAVSPDVVAEALPDCQIISSDVATLEGALVSFIDIATATGAAAAGRSLTARLRSRLHWVWSLVAELEAPRVAVIEWLNPIHTPSPWVPDMVTAAGGINVFGKSGAPSVPSTVAELEAARPDVVVVAFRGSNLHETQARFNDLTSDPGFVQATRFARTFAVDAAGFVSRPGPRLVDGVELLAWAFHRPHPRLKPPVGRGANLIEAGWVDVAALPVTEPAPV